METMEMKEEISARLAHWWREAGLAFNPGVSRKELDGFEKCFKTKLKPDMRAYFLRVNGMEPGEMDPQCHIRFWPLEEVKPVQEEVDAPWREQYMDYYLFADYLLWSHGYAIDLNPASQGAIVMFGGQTPRPVAESFSDFVRLYLDNSDQIFQTNPPASA